MISAADTSRCLTAITSTGIAGSTWASSRADCFAIIEVALLLSSAALAPLGEVCRRTGWQAHAYVLLSNHYHLLLKTPETNLVSA